MRLACPRILPRAFALILAGLLIATTVPVRAWGDALRVLESDATGVTLQLELQPVGVTPGRNGEPGRLALQGFDRTDAPGRPGLPYATTLIALPPGARATVRVTSVAEPEVREGVRLGVSGRPAFVRDPAGSDFVPTRQPVAAIADGPWPASEASLGEAFTLRRQRVATLTLTPVRYDQGAGRLVVRRVLTVRVDFTGSEAGRLPGLGRGAPDGAWDAVLERAVANFAQARAWRETPQRARRTRLAPIDRRVGGAAPAAVQAFDESNPEVRVRIDSTAFYSLRYADLSAKGYPAGVPVAQVSVHRHEFVPGVQPPYVTIELPIQVDDTNANGVFDNQDRIYVYARTWAERSGATAPQRRWGDADDLFATFVNGQGLRFAQRPSWNLGTGLPVLASYPYRQHFEQNGEFFRTPDDTIYDPFHWTINLRYFDRQTFPFPVNQLDPALPVAFTVRALGRDYSSHVIGAQVSRPGVITAIGDSVTFPGKQAGTLTGTVPGTALAEGVNSLIVYGRQFGTPPDRAINPAAQAGLDWFEVTYWRQYRALRNQLDANSADAAGPFQVHATGFSARLIRLFDVTDPDLPVQMAIAPADTAAQIQQVSAVEYALDFQDDASGGRRRYVAFSSARGLPPANYSAVTRHHLTDPAAADMVIIAPEALVPSLDPLVALRQREGLAVAVAPLEGVFDEFNGGRKSAHAIKRYVRHAYDNWSTRFVLLVGDASQDPMNYSGTAGPDLVPTMDIVGPVGIPPGREIVPSDPWYGCLDNSCDLNDATADVPDIFIGRIPVVDATQTAAVVAKLVAYDSVTADQTWRDRIVMSSDDAFSGDTYFGGGGQASGYCYKSEELVFQEISDTVTSVIRNHAGLARTQVTPFYLSTYLAGEPVNSNNCRPDLDATRDRTHAAVTPQLLSLLRQGCLWWNWQGHANQYVLAHENLYLNSGGVDDKDALDNLDKPFLFSAFSCHANAFASVQEGASGIGPSLGEEMVTLPGRGAIASWASTGYEILPSFYANGEHINTALARALFEDPPSDPYLDYRGARVILGESITLALLRYVTPYRFLENGIGLTYNLLGDPATRMSIGAAQTLVRANGVDVQDGQPVRLHSAGDTLHLEVDVVSNIQITRLVLERSDGARTDTIPASDYTITPAFPDTGLGAGGGRRFHIDYHTTLSPTDYRYTIRTVDRYGVAGSFAVQFQFLAQLRLHGAPIADNDAVPGNASLTIQVLSPKPLNPAADLTLTINGQPQPFSYVPANGDTSGREWLLSWNHELYATGSYTARLTVAGGASHDMRFQVTSADMLANLFNFPNPFDDSGTVFSFSLINDTPADVMIRVFTVSGRMVYERVERGLAPGYHQLAWDGRDHEGDGLANGIYLCRIVTSDGSSSAVRTLRLVKVRKPRRVEDTSTTGG